MRLATLDLSPPVLEALVDGKMLFAFDQHQDLQGDLLEVFLALNARYGLMPAGVVMTGPGLVTPEHAQQVIALSKQGIR